MSLSESYLGHTLSVEQQLAVKNALVRLKAQDETLGAVSFWGVVQGVSRDYIVAQAVSLSDSVTKHFFFSDNGGVGFSKIPEVDEWIASKAQAVRGRFTGDITKKYKEPKKRRPPTGDDDDEEEEDEDEEEEEEEEEEEDEDGVPKPVDPSKRKLTELERLAYAVSAVDSATAVVPVGSYLLTPTRLIVKNQAFEGLSSADAKKLGSYLHFRAETSPRTQALIRKTGVANNPQFLDRVDDDKPAGAWRLVEDDSGVNVSLRNLLWPGYEFKHDTVSGAFSGAYFGTGERNDDLLFML